MIWELAQLFFLAFCRQRHSNCQQLPRTCSNFVLGSCIGKTTGQRIILGCVFSLRFAVVVVLSVLVPDCLARLPVSQMLQLRALMLFIRSACIKQFLSWFHVETFTNYAPHQRLEVTCCVRFRCCCCWPSQIYGYSSYSCGKCLYRVHSSNVRPANWVTMTRSTPNRQTQSWTRVKEPRAALTLNVKLFQMRCVSLECIMGQLI